MIQFKEILEFMNNGQSQPVIEFFTTNELLNEHLHLRGSAGLAESLSACEEWDYLSFWVGGEDSFGSPLYMLMTALGPPGVIERIAWLDDFQEAFSLRDPSVLSDLRKRLSSDDSWFRGTLCILVAEAQISGRPVLLLKNKKDGERKRILRGGTQRVLLSLMKESGKPLKRRNFLRLNDKKGKEIYK